MCDSMSRTAGRLRSPGEGLDRRGPRPQEIRRMYLVSGIRRFDHVGITVADLDAATEFFVGLGLEVEGRMFMEGEFVDTVIGIPGSRSQVVMLRPPDGGPGLELSSFVRPEHEPGSPTAMANELDGDLPAAATAYAQAARRATNVAERDHLVRQAARARAAEPCIGSATSAARRGSPSS